MSLKSIRENYSRMLTAFQENGVKLTESQKSGLDQFMLALESKIEQTKQSTIKATQKVVESKMAEEYKAVFESILKHQKENTELAGKIQSRVHQIKESKKMAEKVDQYLDLYLDEMLPEQKIVDYDKMHKLEKVMESLKDTLLVNDDAVEAKTQELKESYDARLSDLEKKLSESTAKEESLKKQVDRFKAEKLLESKTSDLPLFEARKIKKHFAGASVKEINDNFKTILESVQAEAAEAVKAEEKSLEEEIAAIIDGEGNPTLSISDKVTKAPAPEAEPEVKDEESETEGDAEDEEAETDSAEDAPASEPEDEKESDGEDDDDVVLSESEKIDSDLMKAWIDRANGITPIG